MDYHVGRRAPSDQGRPRASDIALCTLPPNADHVAIAVAGDRLYVVGGGPSILLVLDARTGQELDRRKLQLTGGASISEHPDGSHCLTRGPDVVDELNPATGRSIATCRVPLEADHGMQFGGAIATSPGSLWLTVWPDGSPNGSVIRFERE